MEARQLCLRNAACRGPRSCIIFFRRESSPAVAWYNKLCSSTSQRRRSPAVYFSKAKTLASRSHKSKNFSCRHGHGTLQTSNSPPPTTKTFWIPSTECQDLVYHHGLGTGQADRTLSEKVTDFCSHEIRCCNCNHPVKFRHR